MSRLSKIPTLYKTLHLGSWLLLLSSIPALKVTVTSSSSSTINILLQNRCLSYGNGTIQEIFCTFKTIMSLATNRYSGISMITSFIRFSRSSLSIGFRIKLLGGSEANLANKTIGMHTVVHFASRKKTNLNLFDQSLNLSV